MENQGRNSVCIAVSNSLALPTPRRLTDFPSVGRNELRSAPAGVSISLPFAPRGTPIPRLRYDSRQTTWRFLVCPRRICHSMYATVCKQFASDREWRRWPVARRTAASGRPRVAPAQNPTCSVGVPSCDVRHERVSNRSTGLAEFARVHTESVLFDGHQPCSDGTTAREPKRMGVVALSVRTSRIARSGRRKRRYRDVVYARAVDGMGRIVEERVHQ